MQASSDMRWLLRVLETILLGAVSWFFLVNGVVVLVIKLFPLAGSPEYMNIGIITIPGAPILGAVAGLVAGVCMHSEKEGQAKQARKRLVWWVLLALPVILTAGLSAPILWQLYTGPEFAPLRR